MLNVPAVGTAG